MSEEMKYPDMTLEDLSYEMRHERRTAMAQLLELRQARDKRHEEETALMAQKKCFISRWRIKIQSAMKDFVDAENEEELQMVADPMAAFAQYKKEQG